MAEIQQENSDNKGRFFLPQEGKTLAEMTYSWAGTDRIIIDHTEVSDSLRGQGVGEQMVRMAVDFARAKGIHIIPLCPFARAVFQKNQELKDVL
ncbi:MAG: GNAT family N-acetyltransferase [Cyclobacteriaceae bacterium]